MGVVTYYWKALKPTIRYAGVVLPMVTVKQKLLQFQVRYLKKTGFVRKTSTPKKQTISTRVLLLEFQGLGFFPTTNELVNNTEAGTYYCNALKRTMCYTGVHLSTTTGKKNSYSSK